MNDSYIDAYTVNSAMFHPYKHIGYMRKRRTRGNELDKLFIMINVLDTKYYTPIPDSFVEVKIDTGASCTMLTESTWKKLCEQFSFEFPPVLTEKTVAYICQTNGSIMVGCKYFLNLYVCNTRLLKVPVIVPPTIEEQRIWYSKRYNTSKQAENPFSEYTPKYNCLGMAGLLDEVLISLDSETIYLFKRKVRTGNSSCDNHGGLVTVEKPSPDRVHGKGKSTSS